MSGSASDFDPERVNLSTTDISTILCYLNDSGNDYNGHLGARISALFVILICSTGFTVFPVLARRTPQLRIPISVYLFARYFGAGVIVATAFIHLLDPAYSEIGPESCVGMTGHWADYAWCPAIVLASLVLIFLVDLAAERYVETKYNVPCGANIETLITHHTSDAAGVHVHHSNDDPERADHKAPYNLKGETSSEELGLMQLASYHQQISAFLILEFGVIFHSVIIGLNLGVVGDEFATLYPVLVFHQSFEGLGIGARLSAIDFPPRHRWVPWALCAGYGLTTPIAIAIGLGVRTTYEPGSYTANVVSGILDAFSAGILIYTGLVELLARDFLFDPQRTKDNKRLTFMVVSVLLGAGIMALLGKWA